MKAITNTKLIMEDGIIWDGTVLFDGDTIVAADWADRVTIPEGCECIDAEGLYTAPGLIDIHCHGSEKDFFTGNTTACCQHFLEHGHTTVLPTFYHIMDMDAMIEGGQKIRKASKTGVGRIMDGLYMEGPFMDLGGSFRNSIKWKDEIRLEDYEKLTQNLGDLVRVWAIDPDRVGIEEFMAYTREHFPKVIFTLGHSVATYEKCKKLAKYGITLQTHHGDSGKVVGLAQGTIGAGCDEYALYNPDMYAELICDQVGIHVVPDMVKMVVRIKGVEKMILITDSMPAAGDYKNNEALGIAYGPDLNYDDEGRLGGSHLTLDNACRNLMTHTGYGLCHAIRMATLNPAKMLGIDNKVGSLEAGKKANLIIIDDMVHIKKVFLQGDLMVDNT